jgi:2-polyprenyl-6-hydroxyphenyl methylase/3-demethylubiquinone-9 3-methyltransferase
MTQPLDPARLITHGQEVRAGDRFAFGKNWASFLAVLDDQRINEAQASLKTMLGATDLAGKTFLDVGSGSGLFSLAARRLGARVTSFDYDPQSVACTRELKRRYFEGDSDWTVQEGSVLDDDYLASLGPFDVVYSWGVLHHTGAMWTALRNVDSRVAAQGLLYIAIYNDQGPASKRWLAVKKLYNRLPRVIALAFAVLVYFPFELKMFLGQTLRGRPAAYFSAIANYKAKRGMSWSHDKIDWIGGLPFEVAKPEAIFEFYTARGYQLIKLSTCAGGLGCNQYVFRRQTPISLFIA